MATVDVVLPVRNGERYVGLAIESVVSQTFGDWNLIVIDDLSTDRTAKILLDYQERMPGKVQILQGSGRGISAALNLGLDATKAPYIARMDADDIMMPERLERQQYFLQENPSHVLVGSYFTQFGDVAKLSKTPRSKFRHCLALFSPFCHPSVMLRRSIVDHGLRYDEMFPTAEDYWFFYGASKFGDLANIPDSLLLYRRHSKQVSGSQAGRRHLHAAQIVDLIADDRSIGRSIFSRSVYLLWEMACVPTSNWRDAFRGYKTWLAYRLTCDRR